MRALALLLAFVSCVSAYSVLTPNPTQGWTNQGAQTYVIDFLCFAISLLTYLLSLTWQRVATDKLNFTAVLDNQVCNSDFFSPIWYSCIALN